MDLTTKQREFCEKALEGAGTVHSQRLWFDGLVNGMTVAEWKGLKSIRDAINSIDPDIFG